MLARWMFVCLSLLLASPALAEICLETPPARSLDEAAAILNESFVAPVPGSTSDKGTRRRYNAKLINCNRKRDSLGKKIEQAIPARHTFPNRLPPQMVNGTFRFYGLYPLRYSYQLERKQGIWIVTVPIRFHWPASRKTQWVDLPYEKAAQLGLTAPGKICAKGDTVYEDLGNREVTAGFIGDAANSPAYVAKKDVMYYKDMFACRVGRETLYSGKTALNHIRDYWRDALTSIWNRPGFEINPVFIDCENSGGRQSCDKPSEADVNIWEKSKVVWDVRFNLDPDHRPSFKRWAGKWNHMHTGVSGNVVAHELGHKLGLDDEYGAPDITQEVTGKDCSDVYEDAHYHYIMCWHDASANGAQAVYPWIISRRYAAAKPPACKMDDDCNDNQYCDKGWLTIGRNECVSTHAYGTACSRDEQCGSERVCQGKPAGKCIKPASKALGRTCLKDNECISGSCDKDGRCQCKDDNDCGKSGQYCDRGWATIGKNQCKSRVAYGANCSRDEQCKENHVCQGKPLGKCIKPDTLAVGAKCIKDAECISGSCDKDGRCQCKDDKDCNSATQYCDKGWATLGKNQCKAKVLFRGSCSRDEQCGTGHICKGKPLGNCIKPSVLKIGELCLKDAECITGSCNKDKRCQCKTSRDCGSSAYCATGTLGIGKNTCVAYKKKGDSCSDDKQCKPKLDCKGVVGFKKCK